MTQTPFQTFLASKGISEQTAETWGVTGHGNEAHFPYPEGRKIRGNINGSGARTFKYEGKSGLYRRGERFGKTVFICEGESDPMRLDQELRDHGYPDEEVSVCGISGINGWKSEYALLFEGVEKIRALLDNDSDYSVRATVDKAYARMAADLGRSRVRRIYLPPQIKDVVLFFENYSFASFLTIAKPSQTTNYNRLDLNATPPEFKWLVDGLICQGDVSLLVGPPNVGKSFISMGLALGIAEGHDSFLGQRLRCNGSVLYIDEENPVDVVYHRLISLGMTAKGRENIHYYHRQGIRLDRNPEKVLDDALLIKPELIVIDSLTRFHSVDENNSGTINQLFNEAIMPLARETGASVVLLHHTKKGEFGSDFDVIRGSSDIGAAVDNAIRVVPTLAVNDHGQEAPAIELRHIKSRRTKRGARFQIFIEEDPVGGISLVTAKDGFD